VKLTVREAAKLLSVTEDQLYRWVDERAIPFYMVEHRPRFARTELLEWATQKRLPVSPEMFESEEGGDPGPSLEEALSRGGIHHDLPGGTREAILRAAVKRLPSISEEDQALLLEVLLARESAVSTGIGDGIAIPHVRSPIVSSGDAASITLCFLEKPLDFQAVDGKPVHTLFLICSPTIAGHLRLLAKLSLALLDPGFKAALSKRGASEEILAEARRIEALFARPRTAAAAPPERP
jgi:PTS system nitrogen regulatory IIA component